MTTTATTPNAVITAPITVVTTSWDDGHVLDLKLADLLRTYRVAGTFYVAPDNHEIPPKLRLRPADIKLIARRFEIGAHTVTHPRLPQVSLAEAKAEIQGAKPLLEAVTGRPVTSFCYPGGAYTAAHLPLIAAAGYTYARTVERFATATGPDALQAPTTIHAYRHWSDLWPIARFARFNPVRTLQYLRSWDQLAMAQFDRLRTTGGVFHLWGHSWEIERNGDWGRLENVLRHISGHRDVHYVTNRELV